MFGGLPYGYTGRAHKDWYLPPVPQWCLTIQSMQCYKVTGKPVSNMGWKGMGLESHMYGKSTDYHRLVLQNSLPTKHHSVTYSSQLRNESDYLLETWGS